jgi:hypothetical protein
MKRRSAITLAATGSLLAARALAARKLLTGLPLVWKPTTELGSLTPINIVGLGGRKIQLQPFTDARENRELIGENREDADEGKVFPVTTRDDVSAFVTDRFRFVARYYGLDTVANPGDVTIAGEVRSFFVTEDNTYQGDVSVKVRVISKDESVSWEGVAAGSENRWGRSYKADNYLETLCDSLINLAHRVLSNAEFMAALRK